MLQISFIRESKDQVIEGLKRRNFKDEDLKIVDDLIALDDEHRSLQTELENALAERNQMSKAIGELMKTGKADEASAARNRVNELKAASELTDVRLGEITSQLTALLYTVPNIPHESVPFGVSAEDNDIYKDWPHPLPEQGENAQPHWELAKKYNLFDYWMNRIFRFAHTLNGSALALARIVAALMENNQTPEGIVIPKALRPYTGFERIS